MSGRARKITDGRGGARTLTSSRLPSRPLKRCPLCGLEKRREGFGRNRSTADGLQVYCRECHNADEKRRHADWVKTPDGQRRQKIRRLRHYNKMVRRRSAFRRVRDDLGCLACGTRRAYLHLHHVDAESKRFDVSSSWGRTLSDILAEIEKCVILCGSCHGAVHAGSLELDGETLEIGRRILAEEAARALSE